jgi:glycosyltransferase involved in cell wall biosynthesis
MTEIGGLRPLGLAKYLPENGWSPVILTSDLPGDQDSRFHIIQAPYHDKVKQLKKKFGFNPKKTLNTQFNVSVKKDTPSFIDQCVALPAEIITFPDEKIGWYDSALHAGERILKHEPIDVILSSSYPVTCHLIAKTLARKYRIPWVADFRDLWSENHYDSYSRVRKYFDRKLEIKTLKNASAITTVSQPLAEKLSVLHKRKNVFVIKNGFDPDLINLSSEVNKKFTLVHTGGLYLGKRDPSHLFTVINELCIDGAVDRDDIRIEFFGYPKSEFSEGWLQEEIERNHLQDLVILHGEVSHESAVVVQQKAQLLLLLTWDNPEERGVYTGKIFEYLAARRPILSMGYREGGAIKDLLNETQAGIHAGDEKEIKTAVLQAYREYREFGAVQYRGVESEVMKYSHITMAKNFAEVLDSAMI